MADEMRVASKVMSEYVDGREVFIVIKTEYPAGSSTPGRTYVVGPQGQITDSYEEMLELLGLDTRARLSAAGEDWDDHPPGEEMSDEEVKKELARDQQAINAMGDFIDFRLGHQRRRAEPSAVVQPAAESAGSAMLNVSRAELERGFADRFPSLPPTKLQYPALDLSAAPPENWVKIERMRRARIFEDEHGDHPLHREHRPANELTQAETDMRMVREGEYIKFVHPERYEAALDAEKYRTYFQRFPEDALTRDGIKGPRCRFIRADGTKCGSPALKGGRMCYFHSRTEGTRKRKRKAKQAVERFQVPVLEDDLAIQMAVTNVCRQLASEPLDTKRASLLLYGLQVASVAVRRTAQKTVITKK